MTMGSAWASCLDIGKRYSGIVSGCMNTIGNLGGAVAGYATGWILDLMLSPARGPAASEIASVVGGLGATGVGARLDAVAHLSRAAAESAEAVRRLNAAQEAGWTVNFIIFGGVYVIATLFWLRFDSTKPVVPDRA
jgi:hypothetical protein